MKPERLRAWLGNLPSYTPRAYLQACARPWGLFVPVLLCLIAMAGCGKQSAESGKAAEAPPKGAEKTAKVAIKVDVTKPERHTVRQVIVQPGHIEAFEQTPIYVKISGYIRKLHVDIEDRVKGPQSNAKDPTKVVRKGQLLAELDVPEMVADLQQKRSLVAKADEEIKQAEEIVKVAEAVFHTAEFKVKEEEAGRIQAQAEFDRWDVEFRKAQVEVSRGTLDQQTLDVTRYKREAARAAKVQVEAKVQSAETAVKESAARWRKAEVDVKVAKARHQAAQADQAYVAALLDYAEVRAPYDGVVMVRNINTGDFVQPSATGGKGEPLFVVASQDKVRLFFEAPETEAVFIDKTAQARIRVRGLKGEELTGKVVRSSWGLNPKERTLRVEINMENKDGRLRPGMYAVARITLEHKAVWTVPVTAVGVAEEQPYCFRVEGGKAVRTPVQLGLSDGKHIEIRKRLVRQPQANEGGVWEDCNGTEEFVARNPAALTDGQGVTVSGKRD
ncbi:MAG TPA: efflux RND transporter periplasmic adaptor subunit [Gemmataceae bacterium]|nr:efflux RND transporter periplasmic adaptor subunit [Gemmataceae bacterium]